MALFCLLLVSLTLSLTSPEPTYAQTRSNRLVTCQRLTATMEFSTISRLPAAIAILSSRRHPLLNLSAKHATALAILALSGTIELNPGPQFTLYSLNIRSFNQVHAVFLSDTLSDHHYDVKALTETWLTTRHTPAELADITPCGYDLLSCPRPSGTGGGVAFLIREALAYSFQTISAKSFEAISATIKLPNSSPFSIFNVYRPPDSSSHSQSFSTFLSDFQAQLSIFATTPHPFLITGDFNIHIDDTTDNHSTSFMSLLSDVNFIQYVSWPTHLHHTLDLIIAPSSLDPHVKGLSSTPSDHMPVLTTLNMVSPTISQTTSHPYRRIASIDIAQFISDIANSVLILNPPSTLDDLVQCYNSTLSYLLDTHAPLITKTAKKKSKPWFTAALHALKIACRKADRTWKQTRSTADRLTLKTSLSKYYTSIRQAKEDHYSSLINTCIGNPKKLWQTVNNILHRNKPTPLPMSPPLGTSLSTMFASFFKDKIDQIRVKITSSWTNNQLSGLNPHIPEPSSPPASLLQFRSVTEEEVTKVLQMSPDKYCDLDPIPTSLLKKCSSVLVPVITIIVNLSFSSGTFPENFKNSVIKPLLKKANLDKESLSNYRPVSNLSFISKLTEKLVKLQLTEHLDSHSLFNIHQSAYTKSHSTETVLLSLHDHLIQSMAHQKVTGLCLLDLSAAFDTIDHSILLTRLSSWFGLGGTALTWISSYLSSRTFSVSIRDQLSPASSVSYGVPQGSVLGPLLFIMYTTPLSHLIQSHDLNHHLYADDTQLFISIKPSEFQNAASSLSAVFQSISNWMSLNMLALNPSKTEFLLIGSPQQLNKISDTTLTLTPDTVLSPANSARNLGFIFDPHLSYHSHISTITKSCFIHIRDLRRIRPCLDYTTAANIATSLVQSKLDYCNSLYIGLPKTELNRLQNIQNTLARAVANQRRNEHITPTLQSLHWLKIPERINYKVLSITYNVLSSSKPAYLSKLISLQPARSTRSSKLITLYHPAVTSSRAILNRSYSYSIPRLWNSLPAELRTPIDSSTPGVHSLSRQTFLSKLKTHLFRLSYPTSTPHTTNNTHTVSHSRPPD